MNILRTDLPPSCPPQNALQLPKEFGRLIYSTNPTSDDFLDWIDEPHNSRAKIKAENECRSKSMSVFELNPNYFETLAKIPRIREKYYGYAIIKISKGDGIVVQSGKCGHYSWWRSNTVNPINTVVQVERNNEN